MKLYTYYRSSASYRVRIGLNLKGIAYTSESVNLLETQQKSEAYLASNPQGLIPALELEDGSVISQSTAILEWLEESYPQTPLLPTDSPLARAKVRSLVNHIACDIHPLLNLSILIYLKESLDAEQQQVDDWYSQWIHRGFDSIERIAAAGNGEYCIGDRPGLADCYLIPQVYNAQRFNVDISAYPAIASVCQHCNSLEPFLLAHPDQQADKPQ
ncbi:MAG: maleylacetoacetate isomerase [Halioglobus sp.]